MPQSEYLTAAEESMQHVEDALDQKPIHAEAAYGKVQALALIAIAQELRVLREGE